MQLENDAILAAELLRISYFLYYNKNDGHLETYLEKSRKRLLLMAKKLVCLEAELRKYK